MLCAKNKAPTWTAAPNHRHTKLNRCPDKNWTKEELAKRNLRESNWCLEPRTSSANPWHSRKLNEMRSASSLHSLKSAMKPLRLFLRNQAARTEVKFPGSIHVKHHLALLNGHENVFFCTHCGAVNAGGVLRLLKSQCDGSGESRQKARRKLVRGLMPNEHVMADAKRAF